MKTCEQGVRNLKQPEPSSDQHHSRAAIRAAADNPNSCGRLKQQILDEVQKSPYYVFIMNLNSDMPVQLTF